MKVGDLVIAEVFGGSIVRRKIVAICGKTVYLATLEEAADAEKQGREPECVGFKEEFVRAK